MLGADEMLDAIFNAMDQNEIEEMLEFLEREYEINSGYDDYDEEDDYEEDYEEDIEENGNF